jgi:choline-sulfatase
MLESLGAVPAEADADLQGWSLLQSANQNIRERTILSEFHAALSRTGSFMIRFGHWKYIYHVNAAPQLFDLQADPTEIQDLSQRSDHAEVLQMCACRLRTMIDPDAVDRQARAHQAQRLQAHGGANAIRRQGFKIPYTPPPEVH